MEEFKEPRRGRPRKKIKIIDSSIRIKGGGYDWGKVVDGVKDYSSKKEVWREKRNKVRVSDYEDTERVQKKRTKTGKRQAAVVEAFKSDTGASKLASSAKNKYVQKQRSARKGISSGESKAIQSGFKVQIAKASRSALASLGIQGTLSPSLAKRNPLTKAFQTAIRFYVATDLKPAILGYMKEKQLKSVGSGRLYPIVKKNGLVYENHRASLEGQPAANLSGELAHSYRASLISTGFALKLKNTAPYAQYLNDHGRLTFWVDRSQELKQLYDTSYIKNKILSQASASLYDKYQNITRI